jgi:hypothetical protein
MSPYDDPPCPLAIKEIEYWSGDEENNEDNRNA